MSAYIKNIKIFQINYVMLHLEHLEKQEQAKFKTSRSRAIIKIKVEINGGKIRKKIPI
jgi:hypothetical protein